MTYALVAVSHSTYGGVYLANPFTTTGAQPTWTKLTTAGLPSLEPDIFRVDYFDPLNTQYLGFGCDSEASTASGTIYVRRGGDWSLIMNIATAKTVTGNANINHLAWLWTDPYVEGSVYTICAYNVDALNATSYVLRSFDYGATWAASGGMAAQDSGSHVEARGDYYIFGLARNVLGAAFVGVSSDFGATWDSTSVASGRGVPSTFINPINPAISYSHEVGGIAGVDRILIGGPPTTITKQDTGYTGPAMHPDHMWVDEYNDGYAVVINGADIDYTTDRWTSSTTTNTDVGDLNNHAIADFWNENSDDLVFGTNSLGPGARIYHISSKTDTTVSNRSGANSTVPPYTDSIPQVGYVVEYGIWAGSPPASTGVFVYSVEMEDGDNTWDNSIFSYESLGAPMGGDRSSFRDMYADGFDVYHAEDVHAATPQIHAPWPASSGTAPVSDGTKWVPTDIITQAEFDYSFYLPGIGHCPVTLDADAELILDLQGGCIPAQEIGLDVQQPTYVWMGPSFAPADEPTFQPMYIEQLANVTTTAPIADGEVLTFDASIGQWVNDTGGGAALEDLHEHIVNEDHSDDCDGAETNFSTAYVFRANSTQVYLNGIRQYIGPSYYLEDVDLNGITFDTAPENDDILIMDYIVEYLDYLSVLLDSESIDLIDSEGTALTDSEG